MSEKLPGIVQIAFNKKQTRCLVVTASGPPGNNMASGQSKNITEKDSILCNDAIFGRNNFILIFMQRSVYNVVFVSC